MHGDSVDADTLEAWAWFRLAAQDGLAVASVNADMVRAQIDDAQFEAAHRRFDTLGRELAAQASSAPRISDPFDQGP